MTRKYLRSDLARDLHLTRGAITKLAHRGMPTYSLPAAEAWRAQNINPNLGRTAIPRAQDPRPSPRHETPGPFADMADARLRRELAEACMAELALQEKTGQLVRRRDVVLGTMHVNRALRDRLLNLGDRIAPQLPGDDDLQRRVNALINEEVRAALRQVCEDLAVDDLAVDDLAVDDPTGATHGN